jgi:hypothetical protein
MAKKNNINLLIIVAALGYFVDIYDLIVFNVVKNESLQALGFVGEALKTNEIYLFNLALILSNIILDYFFIIILL